MTLTGEIIERECRFLLPTYNRYSIAMERGRGRTGTIFAFQAFGMNPDVVAIAKAIAAGLPLGAGA
jgi:adenosylmethionine-8-amino-7-oxononanoate aminotransferase